MVWFRFKPFREPKFRAFVSWEFIDACVGFLRGQWFTHNKNKTIRLHVNSSCSWAKVAIGPAPSTDLVNSNGQLLLPCSQNTWGLDGQMPFHTAAREKKKQGMLLISATNMAEKQILIMSLKTLLHSGYSHISVKLGQNRAATPCKAEHLFPSTKYGVCVCVSIYNFIHSDSFPLHQYKRKDYFKNKTRWIYSRMEGLFCFYIWHTVQYSLTLTNLVTFSWLQCDFRQQKV